LHFSGEEAAVEVLRLVRAVFLLGLVQVIASANPGPGYSQSNDELSVLNAQVVRLHEAGKYSEAEPVALRAVALAERLHGPDHLQVGTALNNLGLLYRAQGRYTEAEPIYLRYLGIREKAFGPDHPNVVTALNNLAVLYKVQGRFREAERLYKRSLAIREKVLGAESPHVGTLLGNLGQLYYSEGRYAEAEVLAKRDLAIRERAPGPDQLDLSRALNNLALIYDAQHRYADAEPLYKRALKISEAKLGPEHPDVSTTLSNLAVVYANLKRFSEAEELNLRALEITERQLGPDHPGMGIALNNLAVLYQDQKRYAEAEQLYLRSAAVLEKSSGPDHPQLGIAFANVGMLRFLQSNWDGAIDSLQRSTGTAITRYMRSGDSADFNPAGADRREVVQSSRAFKMMVRAAGQLATDKPDREPELRSRMFAIAQWAPSSDAAASLAQMAARQAKGAGELARLVREQQDLAAEWQARDKALILSQAQPPERRNRDAEARLRDRLAKADARIAEINKILAKDFPEFSALASPAPLEIYEVQALLHQHEALVFLLDTAAESPTHEQTFVWIVTKTDSRWVRSELGTKALTDLVAALRCGLDVTLWLGGRSDRRCRDLLRVSAREEVINGRKVPVLPFDLAKAHELYAALFGPVQDLIKDKHLLVVPSGPLTSLPFNVLVTEAPKSAVTVSLADYRSAAWFGTHHPITVLPAVSSLKALRHFPRTGHARKAYLGVGNPLLDGRQADSHFGALFKARAQAARDGQRCPLKPQPVAPALEHRSLEGFDKMFRGAQADIEQVRMAAPLPETADELCEVGRLLGVAETDILLGGRATEAAIKDLSDKGRLSDYAVVHFATHGALFGQSKGAAEAGLILTPPAKGTIEAQALERDDGFLAASEIAGLKLDADWVILSACNTAGGAGENAEPLSGLARAFFYAGARALLVSHWPVDSEAAVKLTTKAFAELKFDPTIGRSEAFRRSMHDLLVGGSPIQAHPMVWAPFVVVGEGAR
jgi:CHAT domain-containing protein/tetratricopeptide (TPR) repeat protein